MGQSVIKNRAGSGTIPLLFSPHMQLEYRSVVFCGGCETRETGKKPS